VPSPRELEVRAPENPMGYGAALLLAVFAFSAPAKANIAVLLEEPYSYDGALAGTGHAAVYLTRVCAETPVKLRLCEAGERGAVISRYHRISGYDWIAIPLVPYLYAVENIDQMPLYADPKLVVFLRDQYRRAYLEEFAPDGPGGETPKGDWYELAGSSYDRTNYGFEIETTRRQDEAFVDWMNTRPNREKYNFVSRNCADFVREVLNFYYPKSESRGNIADLFVSTPKHGAKSLVEYARRHPDLEFTHFVIPQVPGTVKRSRPVHGVVESVFRAKKYVLPLAVFHPIIVGGVASVYVVGDRFNPARRSGVFSFTGEPEPAPTPAERRVYSQRLRDTIETARDANGASAAGSWNRFVEAAAPALDAQGHAKLEATMGGETLQVPLTRAGLESGGEPSELQAALMIARMKQYLKHGRAPRTSSSELRQDWQLLQQIEDAREAQSRPCACDAGQASTQ
jgi:hypothetical protein